MLTAILTWLKENWFLVPAIAGVVMFLLYGRKKMKLEIIKLELEIEQLRKESLIYRPSFKEMKDILEDTDHIATRKLGFAAADPLDDFGIELHRFLNHLLAYYGDSDASKAIMEKRLAAAMQYQPDPYGDGSPADLPFPDPTRVLGLWHQLRDVAERRLPPQTIMQIDSLMKRFSVEHEDA